MSEHDEQAALIHWCELNKNRIPELGLLLAIPNGGKRAIKTATRLKLEGVKAGVPDLFLPVARKGCHGLFIEMKFGKNKTSKAQNDWHNVLIKQGYHVYCTYSWIHAAEVIQFYLGV